MYVLSLASPSPRKLVHPPLVTHPSAWIMFVPGAEISGFNSFTGLPSPLSRRSPREEYPATVSSLRSMVFLSSVAPTVTESEEEPMPDSPSLSGPSFPAATLTVTPASVASLRMRLCISSPSLPPLSWLVMPHDKEMMSMPCMDSFTPGQAVSRLSIIH